MARLKRLANKEDFWRLLVDEQGRCGLSIRAFCRWKAISEPSFYAWRKKLQKRDAERTSDGGSNGRLIPVEIVKATRENATPNRHDVKKPLEICTPGGFTLRFDHDTMPATISGLLDAIRQRDRSATNVRGRNPQLSDQFLSRIIADATSKSENRSRLRLRAM